MMKNNNISNTSLFSVIACSLILTSCATIEEPEDTTSSVNNMPSELILEKSLIQVPAEQREKIGNEKAARESNKNNDLLPKQQTTTKLNALSGIESITYEVQQPPAFDDEKVSISVDSMTIVEFIHYVFGDLLNLNYVIASELQSNTTEISLNLKDPMDKSTLYSTTGQLLSDNDIAIVRKDNIFFIQKKQKGKDYSNSQVGIGRNNIDVPETAGQIVQIIPYVYTDSRSLSNIIKELTGIKVSIDGSQKLITAKGSRDEVLDVMRVLRMLDVPNSAGKSIRLISLAYVAPDTLVQKVTELLNNDGYKVGRDQDVAFVSIPRLGALVVYAVSDEAASRAEFWSKKLDIAVAGNESQFFIFRPQFNKAIDIQASLSPLIGSILSQTETSPVSSGGSSGANDKTASSSSASSIMSVDEVQNALIFNTTADKYRKIKQLLDKLDQLPGQVILDIVIAEVTLSDQLTSGVDWSYSSTGQSDTLDSFLSVNMTNSTGTLSSSIINGNWGATLSYLSTQSALKVLSKPFLIVKDGESATISSGDDIPTITSTSTSDSDTVTNSVQYVSTGIQVSITPTINAKGLINLSVTMSSSTSSTTSSSSIDSPTITSRSISTNIFTGNGQTVALGGLIQDRNTDGGNKIPWLGDIPLIGNLFKYDSSSRSRTELIMLITSKTVQSVDEVDEFGSKILDLYSFPLSTELSSEQVGNQTKEKTE
ncbi:hypothetical protein ACR30L_18580 [Psychromonas sp. PT13]|uniref:hypothetical protein n=1 Tax=Psychromonas sp. PT13 TaxID=3439547 RepID=UPI003EB83DF2